MELKTTEEFIRQVHGAACSTLKTKFEKEFPELFKTELVVGEWYKYKYTDALICYQGGEFSYGFDNFGNWTNKYQACTPKSWKESNHEEVESALIAEAKKRGYKAGVRIKGLGDGEICTLPNGEFEYLDNANALWFGNPNDEYDGFDVFHQGKWADILPEEKTIITKEKALKILAKKLKVSPESIVIK